MKSNTSSVHYTVFFFVEVLGLLLDRGHHVELLIMLRLAQEKLVSIIIHFALLYLFDRAWLDRCPLHHQVGGALLDTGLA